MKSKKAPNSPQKGRLVGLTVGCSGLQTRTVARKMISYGFISILIYYSKTKIFAMPKMDKDLGKNLGKMSKPAKTAIVVFVIRGRRTIEEFLRSIIQ